MTLSQSTKFLNYAVLESLPVENSTPVVNISRIAILRIFTARLHEVKKFAWTGVITTFKGAIIMTFLITNPSS